MIDQSEVSVKERECLAGRIGDFYRLLNNKDWAKCFELVDPKLRDAHRVELPTYSNSLSSFFSKYGPLTVLSLNQLRVYVNVPSKQDNRNFAYGLSMLEDREHRSFTVRERWVKAADGHWYTRMAGMV